MATPDGRTTAYVSGIAAKVNTAIPATVQDRALTFIGISSF
ncbi:hypothetical protein [Mycobacterium scrofulaceum]|nr:hypothetical protein [Mycobacterium scrofulaceum]